MLRTISLIALAVFWASLIDPIEGRGATLSIPSEMGDYAIYGPSTLSTGFDIYRIGTELGGLQTNTVHIFSLPSLNGETLTAAKYSFNYIHYDPETFAVDLWGIGIEYSTSPLMEFYMADSASTDGYAGNVKLQNDVVRRSSRIGETTTSVIGSANLLNYLQGFYSTNPTYTGGAYVFLRLNHDAPAVDGYNGYMVTMREHTGLDPQLTLESSPVPEPSSLALAALAASLARCCSAGQHCPRSY